MLCARNFVILSICLLAISLFGCADSAEELFAKAQQHASERNFRAAVIELKALLQESPDNIKARWLLGTIYLDLEDGASAEKELQRAKVLGVVDDSAAPMLARALLLQAKNDDVLNLEVDGSVSQSSTAELDASRGLAYLNKGELDQAAQLIGKAAQSSSPSDWVLFAQAKLLYANKEFTEAKSVIANVLRMNPSHGSFWSLLGDIHAREQEYSEAEAAYTEAIERRFLVAKDLVKRGSMRIASNNLQGATADAEAASKRAPKYWRAHYLKGLGRFQQSRFSEAAEALEQAYALKSDDYRTNFLLAAANFQLGNIVQSRALAEGVVVYAPGYMPGRKLLALLLVQDGKGQEVESLIRPVVAANPKDINAKNILAVSLLQQGKVDRAAVLFEEIAVRRSDDAIWQLRAGLGLLSANQDVDAMAALERAAELAPDQESVNAKIVTRLIQERLVEQALSIAKGFSDRNRQTPAAWNLLGAVYLSNGDQKNAENAFDAAIALDPGNPKASLGLASIARKNEDHAAAKDYLDRARKLHPDNTRLLYGAAEFAMADGRAGDAQGFLEQAIAIDGSFAQARVVLARVLIEANSPNEAVAVLSSAPKQVPGISIALGEAYLEMGRIEAAKQLFESLRRTTPNSLPVLFGLARVYEKLDDRKELSTTLDQILELAPGNPDASLAKARLFALDGRLDEVEKLLAGLELPDDDPHMVRTKLLLEGARGNASEELKAAKLLFKLKPSSATARALAAAEVRAGDPLAAEATLLDWSKLHPEDMPVVRALSTLYLQLGKHSEAVNAFGLILARDASDIVALNNLAWLLRHSEPKQSLELAGRAYELAGRSISVLDTYAVVLALNGNESRAIEMIDRAIELSGQNPAIKLRRAEIRDVLGDRDSAIDDAQGVASSEAPEKVRARAKALLVEWRQ